MVDNSKKNLLRKLKSLCDTHPNEVMQVLLETPFWPAGIETRENYSRFDDDTRKGLITVFFSPDGDSWIDVIAEKDPNEMIHTHRFRNYFGGGQSDRVHVALKILAAAIKMDNEDHPQDRKY
jgi:hypothetical protein